MAIKRKIKAASKPIVEQTLKPRRKPSQLDLVRNPNFDAAMAQQDYANLMRDQQARLAARQGQFTEGRLMGAPQNQSQQGFGDIARAMSSAGQLPSQQQFDPNAPSLMPIQTGGSMIEGIGDPQSIYNNLQPYASQVGTVPMRRPEQQMQNYQNFLQQGMQNSNTMNQGAMNNFANMQPGMQATQPTPARQMPSMPVAGMGMQQPKQTPPRKFSTVSNSPTRFA